MTQLLLALAAPPAPAFENFVTGGNAALVAALRAFAHGAPDRCLYLWGAPGSGRSHLLGAWQRSCEQAGVNAASIHDDIDQLDDAAQIALFKRINAARVQHGHVLMAGLAAPAQLTLRDDLKSRIAWGLSFELLPLSDGEKETAVRQQAGARGMALGNEVIAYIMTHVRRDMATLSGIVAALDAYSLEHQRPVTLPLVRELFAQSRELDL